jgi:ribosome-binding protein aMBF1 (putative translation factor)
MDDFGQRVRAARGYTNISRETLSETVEFSPGQLERLEEGLDQPSDSQRPRIIKELAGAMNLHESFFTGDFDALE